MKDLSCEFRKKIKVSFIIKCNKQMSSGSNSVAFQYADVCEFASPSRVVQKIKIGDGEG
jgi:hypothetical protein